MKDFAALIIELQEALDGADLIDYYELVCEKTGYIAMLQEKNDMESRGRLENVEELASSIHAFLENDPDNPTLAGFLDEVALYTDLDDASDSDNCVVMMTIHSAKGLEFPQVFVAGMEEGVFPGNRAMCEDEEMEEERRLCYVAMTRAKEKLTMTNARQRLLFGRTTPNMPSRFLSEIPDSCMEWLSKPEPRPEHHWSDDYNDFGGFRYIDPIEETYESRKPKEKAKLKSAGAAPAAPAALPDLQPGQSVQHSAFGKGMVLSVRPMGGDALIEVAFDGVGTKKLMLKAAAQHLRIL